MTNEDKALIRAYAENNMNREQAARQVYMHRNTAGYRFERIKKETGLDPQCFYDLVKLVKMVDGKGACS